MSSLKPRLRSLVLSAFVFALLPLGAMAGSDFSIFSPKAGLVDTWKSMTWSGPTADQISGAEKGATLLQVSLSSDAQPYCGLVLTANAGSEFALTPKQLKSSVVVIHLKSGKTPQGGAAVVGQPLQIGLTFLTKTGETVHGGFNTQVMISASGVQQVKITLPEAVEGVKAVDQIAAISGVRFQYAGDPVNGFCIVDCIVKSE